MTRDRRERAGEREREGERGREREREKERKRETERNVAGRTTHKRSVEVDCAQSTRVCARGRLDPRHTHITSLQLDIYLAHQSLLALAFRAHQ